LWLAVWASSAIPGIFEPVKIGDRILVDGGVLNLMPVAPVMSDMSDLIVAVNLYGDEREVNLNLSNEEIKKQNILERVWKKIFKENTDVVDLSINLMMEVIFRYRCAEYRPDLEIKIPSNVAKWYDFHKALELIEIGRVVTRETLEFKNLV
jgi:NTE family protein